MTLPWPKRLHRAGALLGALLTAGAALPTPLRAASPRDRCPAAERSRSWSASDGAQDVPPPAPAPAPAGGDYRHQLQTTPAGWPLLRHWCVWVEPGRLSGPAARWEERWLDAVTAALLTWNRDLSLERVLDPERAQVLLFRRRPPLLEASGQRRASHGRALLTLREVERQSQWRLEPRVEVLLSPDQRREALQATALHELGHAFGLWGHSDDPADALAAVPGAIPVLELSERDRATLRWLYAQPTRFGLRDCGALPCGDESDRLDGPAHEAKPPRVGRP